MKSNLENLGCFVQKASVFLAISVVLAGMLCAKTAQAEEALQRIVVLGDSLTAGYGLPAGQEFPAKLQEALLADGINVKVENAGVSGDTTAGGLSRVEWAIAGDTKPALVLVALGGNDMLRGLEPEEAEKNLVAIITKIKAQNISVLLAGMKAPMQYPLVFRTRFDGIYKNLAEKYGVELYPFFLEGVALDPKLNQPDGIHPNAEGVAVMVRGILPDVKKLLQN